jgi:hypothetical protein
LFSPFGAAFCVRCEPAVSTVLANCLLVGHNNLDDSDLTRGASVRFTNNTFVTASMPTNLLYTMYMDRSEVPQPPFKRIRVLAAANIFDSERVVFDLFQPKWFKPYLTIGEAEAWLPRRVEWREERNLYQVRNALLWLEIQNGPEIETSRGKDLVDWNRFWGLKDTGSSQGVIHFHGGDLRAKANADAMKLSPEDFRLRADSAGYRAGKDSKDLGADVDLVGPGPAYERWKKTPEYRRWLWDTGQVKK